MVFDVRVQKRENHTVCSRLKVKKEKKKAKLKEQKAGKKTGFEKLAGSALCI